MKISAYGSLAGNVAAGDLLPVVDIDDTTMAGTGTTKNITFANLSRVDWYNIQTMYGADPTGATDSSSAVQAAINAAQAAGTSQGNNLAQLVPTVYVPQGNFKASNLAFSGRAAVRLTGGWGSRLFSTSGTLIDFQNTYLEGLEIDHLALEATGGHVFNNANLKFSWLHHLYLTQNSPGFSIWNQTQAGNQLQDTSFSDIKFWVYPDAAVNTRSVPGWNIQCDTKDSFAEVWFQRLQGWQVANANGYYDMTQYLFSGACSHGSSTAYASTIKFSDCSFHRCYGGAIQMKSASHLVLDGISIYDVFELTSPAVIQLSSDLISVGTFSGGSPSRGVEVRGYTRCQGITPVANSAGDFACTSDTTDILITGMTPTYSNNTGSDMQIQLNSAAKAVLVGNDAGTTILNQATDTVVISPGSITIGGNSAVAFAQKAATANAGYTLVNGTGTIVSWTAPNDGNNHRVELFGQVIVTSAETGGAVSATYTDPALASHTVTLVAAGRGTGANSFSSTTFICAPNTTVSVTQSTALTAGAAVCWTEIWGS